MENKVKCPKHGSEKRVKSGFHNKKQRYLCKACGCNYTVEHRGYPERIRRRAIPLCLEGNGFRRIERILKASHLSLINLVKAGGKSEEMPKKDEKAEVFGARLVVHKFKKLWLWTAVNRATKWLIGFQIGARETKYFQKLTNKISHIDAKFYAPDYWYAYNLVDSAKHTRIPSSD